MTIARQFLKIGSLSNRCLANEPALPPHPSIFLAENLLNVRSLVKHIFFKFSQGYVRFHTAENCDLVLKTMSSANDELQLNKLTGNLISFLEVWRNKTLKFRWKVGENENLKAPACVLARARLSCSCRAPTTQAVLRCERPEKLFSGN